MSKLTIAASAVSALMELAERKGASRQTLKERSRIDSAELQNRDTRVPFDKYVALMHAGQELCHDPSLALHFGEAIDASEISIGCSVVEGEQIDDVFAQVNRYARLSVEVEGVGSGDRFELVRRAGELWIVDARKNPNEFPELTESTFARMVCSTRRSLGETRIFKALHVTHPEPPYRAEYERIFRVPVVFGSDMNGLRIDEALLSNYRRAPSSRYVTAVLKEHAETLLASLDNSQSSRDSVERLLVKLLPTGEACMDTIARELGLSRQTLFRRLKAEGTTFEEVLDELRRTTALRYLGGLKPSVKRTARLVGFSDPTAFSRAFKRWTGSSPSAHVAR